MFMLLGLRQKSRYIPNFAAFFPLTYKIAMSYTQPVKKQCLINYQSIQLDNLYAYKSEGCMLRMPYVTDDFKKTGLRSF